MGKCAHILNFKPSLLRNFLSKSTHILMGDLALSWPQNLKIAKKSHPRNTPLWVGSFRFRNCVEFSVLGLTPTFALTGVKFGVLPKPNFTLTGATRPPWGYKH